MTKKVLIVGAGYAGIEAALTLNKKGRKEDLEITVVDKNDYHTLLTELHEVAGNRIPEEGIRIPLSRVFEYTRVKHVKDKIVDFDFEHNRAKSETKQYDYDYMIMAMGSAPNYFCIEGLEENAFSLWSFDDAVRIREHIKHCFTLASTEADENVRKQLLTFCVGGAGFTGVEMIGELAHWTRLLRKQYGIKKEEIRLVIVDMLPRILNTLNEKQAAKSHKYMEKKLGVEIILKQSVNKVTPDGFYLGDMYIATKTLIWCAGVCAVTNLDEQGVEVVGGAKRVKVDEFARVASVKNKNVYCVGDLSGLGGADGKPYAAMVENAIQAGRGAAMNILNDVRKKEQEKVEVKFHGVMVSIGNYFAVSDIMGRSYPNWISIIMKFFVNVHYLWSITGFYGVARYLYHETLERRQRKLLLEKHWSTRMQAWWALPLRLILGFTWIFEGIKKISEGWLQSPHLQAYMGSTMDITSQISKVKDYFSVDLWLFKFGFYAMKIQQAADATSSASGAAWGSGSGAGDTAAYTLGETFFKIDFPIMNWFVKTFTLSSSGSQMFFQWFIVISEILIGAALIAGLLTFLSAAFSLVLNFTFITSTGIYQSTWWMVAAAIAMMGGAGRAFGLDYYFIPYINNLYERWKKSRRYSLAFKDALDRHELP